MAESPSPVPPLLPHISLLTPLTLSHGSFTKLKSQIRAAAIATAATPTAQVPAAATMKDRTSTKVMVADKSKANAFLGLIFQNQPLRMHSTSSPSLRRKKASKDFTPLTAVAAPTAGPAVNTQAPVQAGQDLATMNNNQARGNDPDAFTPEQDATILQLKGEGKTWANIGAEIGKTKGQVQVRFRDLNKAGAAIVPNESGDKPGGNLRLQYEQGRKSKSKVGNINEPQNAAMKNGGQSLQVAAGNAKKGQAGKKKDANRPPTAANEGRRMTKLKVDDVFNMDDLRVLAEEKLKDDDECWLRLASRLYDRTGKRVHPDQVKAKFEKR